MNLLLPETIKAAEELKNEFKCLNCNLIPSDPYFTGVCDCLLCVDCISKSNLCPICNAQFLKTEAHLSKMIREAILCVNSIVDITNGTFISPEKNEKSESISSSLPDLDLTDDTKPKIIPIKKLPPPMPPPAPTKASTEKSEFLMPKTKSAKTASSQAKSRTKSSGRKSTQSIKIDQNSGFGLDSTQQTPTQIKRSQSMRKGRKNDKGEYPIHLAVMNEDVSELNRLLNEETVDVNVKDNAGWTPLHEACNKGHLDMVELLLKHNADIDALGYQNNTPLHEATLNKKLECVKFLIANGANQKIRNLFGILAKDFVKNLKEFDGIFNAKYEVSDSMSQRVNDIKEVQLMNIATQSQMPSTYAKKMRPKAIKKPLLFPTGMNEEGKQRLTKLAGQLNLQIAKSMNNNVTHVIYNTEKTCSRTMNYMKAILMGIWIVSVDWLEDSARKGILCEENDYEAEGSQKIPKSNGPFKGRMNASCQYPKLFEDCFFYLHGKMNVFDKPDMIKLIELAGGSILKREPKLTNVEELKPVEIPHHLDNENNSEFICAYFILYDLDKCPNINHDYLKTVRPKWLFESIDEFKILNPISSQE